MSQSSERPAVIPSVPANASPKSTFPPPVQHSSSRKQGNGRHPRLSMRSRMQQAAAEFPKPAALRHMESAPPGVDHMKQAGVVLQQQFRGLVRRVQSARTQQAVLEHHPSKSVGNDAIVVVPSKAAIVSPSKEDDDKDESRRPYPLTPKKSSISPIPQRTIKINLRPDKPTTPESLPEAISVWIEACHSLITAPEMHRLLTSTGAVYFHCASLCIQTVALPVTLPIHLGCNAVHAISSVVGGVVVRTTAVLGDASSSAQGQQSSGQGSEEQHSGLVGGLFSLPGTILNISGQVAMTVMAPILGIQSHPPSLNVSQQRSGVSSSPEKAVYDATSPSLADSGKHASIDFLDRLRLDYGLKEVVVDESHLPRRKLFSEEPARASVPVMEQSRFLLRVNDWNVARPTDDSDIYYMDISPAAVDCPKNQELVALALDHFVQEAFALLSSHPICKIVDCTAVSRTQIVRWHPEGATKRILGEMDPEADPGPVLLNQDVLIWSGRFQHDVDVGHGRKHGFFLARGYIPMAPELFVKLLWDNTRTSEYNNFCLGRFTLHGITIGQDDDHSFLNGTTSVASKVIQSEMRVPFAGITVKAVCLMHVRPLPAGDGFMICSRTLDVGPVGIHTTSSRLRDTVAPAKNEILWGINVLRSVPNAPNQTQLTSLSQVGSGVPSFLAQKIGLMGIADFFKNVRCVAEQNVQLE